MAENDLNPTQGTPVILDPLSGPKDSYLEARIIASWGANNVPVYVKTLANLTTGACVTGIGFGLNIVMGPPSPAAIIEAGFVDNYFPGRTAPDGTNSPNTSIFAYIGGGRCDANVEGLAAVNPFLGSQVAMCSAGNGASRDAGGGTGFPMKTVTATGSVANGAAPEANFLNRSGQTIVAGQSVFASAFNSNPPVT